jgi:hypothetical protein
MTRFLGLLSLAALGLLTTTLTACSLSKATGINLPPNPPVHKAVNLYVANSNGNDILVFPSSANGDVAPSRDISGASTGLDSPTDLYVDTVRNLIWVTNFDGASVTAYPVAGTGDIAPTVAISGAATTFVDPEGIYVAKNGTIYVTDIGTASIDIFAPGSNGDVAPTRVITGAATLIGNSVSFIWLDSVGDIWVQSRQAPTGSALIEFAPGATGNATPMATITNPDELWGMSLDAVNNNWASDQTTPGIIEYSRGSTGAATPVVTISGSNTTIGLPEQVLVDTQGFVYLGDYTNNSIDIFAPGASGNATPAQQIIGAATLLDGPIGAVAY